MLSIPLAGALVAIGGIALAQDVETPNFNVTEGLLQFGVNVSTVPALQSFNTIQSRSIDSGCAAACASLGFLFGSQKVNAQNSALYNNFTNSFWSEQQLEVQPHCVFRPTHNTDVSVAVLLSRFTGCPFAARSGGHAAFKGASSSVGGISIWFKDMTAVTLNADKSVASIEPGNNWLSVYSALEPYGLAAVGGRASSIGVGGFVLGGGISYHSNLYGWALDNVQSFEVVTSTGIIVTASQDSFSDLYWALRGGGNNFGLVTKYNLYTIPCPTMRGGARVFTQNNFPEVIDAFINVVNNATVDGKAQQYVAFLQNQGTNIASAELTYVEDVADPAIFRQYRSIPAIADSTSTKTLVEYVQYLELDNPFGYREIYWPITVQLNEEFSNWVVNLFYSLIPQVINLKGANPVIIYQGITIPELNNMTRYGGNALGLDASKGPLHLMHVAFWWQDAADDDTVYAWIHSFWDQVIAKAQGMGIFDEYIYMNYASMFQDPVAGYGAGNKARLQQISSRFDPNGVFQKLQPGYFKLNGAPVTFSG
ncbi:Solanapyrone synthase [Penicillium ucsense]|uniref:Solanapyrone synthase n=1 Tax=Penicillium ucsense TaxID=2839758 RepID=A0A8J8VZM1_9EURO|nr:Solanapyrone synthase [Penicillium ucsense]KAF7732960.1 Solanapyrone synthase [Penicillium ucsense]